MRPGRRAMTLRRLSAGMLVLASVVFLPGMAETALAQSSPQPSADGADTTIVLSFAPPVDRPLLLTKRLERNLPFGTIVRTAHYRLRFTPMQRGYRLRWEQVDNRLDGPPEFLRVAGLGDELLDNETLTISLANDGTILGVTEAPGRQQRLQEAIARLKLDPAFTRLPPERQKALAVQIDHIGAMDAAERADWVIAGIAPLFDLAGQTIVDRHVRGRTGSDYRLDASDNGSLLALTAQEHKALGKDRAIDRAIAIHVSRADGVTRRFDRHVVTSVAGQAQTSDEVITLDEWPADPNSPAHNSPE